MALFKSFDDYANEKGIDLTPDMGEGDDAGYSLAWFEKRNLPAVVQCTNCMMTLTLLRARLDEHNQTFCQDCAREIDPEEQIEVRRARLQRIGSEECVTCGEKFEGPEIAAYLNELIAPDEESVFACAIHPGCTEKAREALAKKKGLIDA